MTTSPQNVIPAGELLKIPADEAAYQGYVQRRRERLLEMQHLNNATRQHSRAENGDEHASTVKNSNHHHLLQRMMLQRLAAGRNVPDPRDFPFVSCRDFSFWLPAIPYDESTKNSNDQ